MTDYKPRLSVLSQQEIASRQARDRREGSLMGMIVGLIVGVGIMIGVHTALSMHSDSIHESALKTINADFAECKGIVVDIAEPIKYDDSGLPKMGNYEQVRDYARQAQRAGLR